MSSRSTIFLSKNNEHWYYYCSDDSFVLEFNCEHLLDFDRDGSYEVFVEKGTALHDEITKHVFRQGMAAKPSENAQLPSFDKLKAMCIEQGLCSAADFHMSYSAGFSAAYKLMFDHLSGKTTEST